MFRQLSTKLPAGFLITKVYSKYGKLNVHAKGGNNTTRFIIEAAVEQSENTCEGCGKDKELQNINDLKWAAARLKADLIILIGKDEIKGFIKAL